MPLIRPFHRATTLLSRQCLRPLSSTTSRSREGDQLSDILSDMTNNVSRRKGPDAESFLKKAMPRMSSRETAAQSEEQTRREEFLRQNYRRWKPGDVYSPHDLSPAEQAKWRSGRQKPKFDAVDALGINPVMEYKNYTMMSEYMTEMGRIKHSSLTGLRPVNQRKMAKALRRAIGLGLMPSVHRHPLLLKGMKGKFN